MFEVTDCERNSVCDQCEKSADVFVAGCHKGVFNGKICGKCLLKGIELRKKAEKKAIVEDDGPLFNRASA